jgi:hypothetical protein
VPFSIRDAVCDEAARLGPLAPVADVTTRPEISDDDIHNKPIVEKRDEPAAIPARLREPLSAERLSVGRGK